MGLSVAYVVFVGLGPAIFLGLIRGNPSVQRVGIGVVSAMMLMVAALLFRRFGAGDLALFGGLGAMWLGWIVTIATAVQAWVVMRRGRERKWSAALGAAAVTLPWFGLSLAVTAG